MPILGLHGWLFSWIVPSKFVVYGTDASDHLLWSQWSAVSRIAQRQNHETDLQLFPAAVWKQKSCAFISQLNFTGLPVNKCFCMKLISNKWNKTKFWGKSKLVMLFWVIHHPFSKKGLFISLMSLKHTLLFVCSHKKKHNLLSKMLIIYSWSRGIGIVHDFLLQTEL